MGKLHTNRTRLKTPTSSEIDAMVMARLRAPFGCEFVPGSFAGTSRWRIHDANDDMIAHVHGLEEGYAGRKPIDWSE